MILQDKYSFLGGARLSADATSITFNATREELPYLAWEDRAQKVEKGRMSTELGFDALIDTDNPRVRTWLDMIAADGLHPFLICSEDGTVGTGALMQDVAFRGVTNDGDGGGLVNFSATISCGGPPRFGQVLWNSIIDGAITASGESDGLDLGAASAGQVVVVNGHISDYPPVGGTTPSITIVIERDLDDTFASPETVETFGPFTAFGGFSAEIPTAASSNEFYRATWTVGGTTPSFTLIVGIALAAK
jgi:hypothetical protein